MDPTPFLDPFFKIGSDPFFTFFTVRDLAEDLSADIAIELAGRYREDVDLMQVEVDVIKIYRRLNTLSRRIVRLSIDASERETADKQPQ